MFKDIATLKYLITTIDDAGYETEAQTTVSYDVFVNKKSVARAEFYSALQSALKPTQIFELRAEEWELTRHLENSKEVYATQLIYNGATYEIIRAFSKNDSMVELTCD